MASKDAIQTVKECIRSFPDFPKPGINFRDIFPVLKDPKVFALLIDILADTIKTRVGQVDVIVGLEARGFLFGPMVAVKLGAAFVPIRKKGKLPGKCASVEYTLEYGKDIFEAQSDAIKEGQKVVIIDDLLATGGTMKAASKLVSDMGGEVTLCLVVIELIDLDGQSKLSHPFHSLIHY
ncbi:adenine phosphoribosyltransferase-like [Glandiceps talaboti]